MTMPIYRLLRNSAFDPDQIQIIAGAFEATCVEFGLVNRDDPLCEMVAKAIMESAQTGERDPERLQEFARVTLNR